MRDTLCKNYVMHPIEVPGEIIIPIFGYDLGEY
jgi:hypothetical protein